VAVRNAAAAGVEGVELFYPYQESHRPSGGVDWIDRINTLANELKLLKTGGTDFHGRAKDKVQLGDVGLTHQQYAAFKQGWQQLREATR
jgi:hypothetical protein